MQPVSTAYREAMAKPLRNRGYIRVLLSIVDVSQQDSARFDSANSSGTSVYSTPANLFKGQLESTHYITLEQNWSRVDGTMFFPPTTAVSPSLESASFMSAVLSSANPVVNIVVSYPTNRYTGLTINFGENYATDFTVTFTDGTVITVSDNTESIWVYPKAIPPNNGFSVAVTGMRRTNTRVRIYSIWLGATKIFSNDIVIDSTMRRHCSPISEDCPTVDFMVKVYDTTLDPADPNSVVYYLEQGQPVTVQYGLELDDGGIEWVKGNDLLLEDWDYTGNYATINAVDKFRHLTTDYPFNGYVPGLSVEDQYKLLFDYAGVDDSEYVISTSSPLVRTPIPNLPVRQGIQVLANAWGHCVSIDRENNIHIDPYQYSSDAVVTDDFVLGLDDMFTKPKIILTPYINKFLTNSEAYSLGGTQAVLASETVTVMPGTELSYAWSGVYGNIEATINDSTTGITVMKLTDSGITLKFTQRYIGGSLVITGYPATIDSGNVGITITGKGADLQWNNPANNRSSIWATVYSAVVLDYFGRDDPNYSGPIMPGVRHLISRLEIDCETRGFPELDPGDIIQIEDTYRPNMIARIEDVSLRFNGAFRGTLHAQVVGGE